MHKFLLAFIFVGLFTPSHAQQKAEQFNISIDYLLYLPQDYGKDTAKQWPVLLFLHGGGEGGPDIQKVKAHGPPKLIEAGKQYPFIVVSPQTPPNQGWEPLEVIKLLRGIEAKYKVDKDRVYMTGLSMGGFGTWATAMKYPEVFAAIVPICGGGDTATIDKLKRMPVWCFHGAKDKTVQPEESYRMVNALKKFNDKVKLTVYPDAEHDSWTATYNNDSVYTWLLEQKKFHFTKANLPESKLQEYAGAYLQKGGDTIHLLVKEGKLILQEQPSIIFYPTPNNSFFFSENDRETEIKFKRNIRRKIEKLLLYADKIIEFDKVN